MFHPVIDSWFTRVYGRPTEIQAMSWPRIRDGANVLVCAETGSGKTLTAFLWALDRLLTGAWESGSISVLYVSPLKALNTDIRSNLLQPLHALRDEFHSAGFTVPDIRVRTRSGDTPSSERQAMVRRPPEIFITTPESLNLILASPRARLTLSTVKVVILDEIHAVIGSKRGTHLITAVDRLVRDAGDFQRIGLSATVRPSSIAASFLGGYRIESHEPGEAEPVYRERAVEVIEAPSSKVLDISVRHPWSLVAGHAGREPVPDRPDQDTWWETLAEAFKAIIARNRTTLIFTNNRRHAEKITLLVNRNEPKEMVYSHHGSLSREMRAFVEGELKAGHLRGIVATSSLELGIDIGELDEVVLAGTPNAVSSAIQRIGRAGHRVGEVSRGTFVPIHARDFLFSAVMADAAADRAIEELHPPAAPLDVLAQLLLSLAVDEAWDIEDMYRFVRTSYPFHALSRRQFDLVLDMLRGRYADTRIRELAPRLRVDTLTGSVRAAEGARMLLYRSGGTIPDRGSYDMRLAGTGGRLGELDEEFVWERRPGEIFSMGAQAWKILRIGDRDVEVAPAGSSANAIPFWKAETLNRDFASSVRILEFLEQWHNRVDDPKFEAELAGRYRADHDSAGEISRFIASQTEATAVAFPHRHHLVIERFRDPRNPDAAEQVVLHTLWGGRVNHPFALGLAQAWEEAFGVPLEVFADNDSIMLFMPDRRESFVPLVSTQCLVTPANLDRLLRVRLESTGFFGGVFRECAGRALLLPRSDFKRRMPRWLTRVRSRKLLLAVMAYPDFPILAETWRSCLLDEFDLDSLMLVLDELASGAIRISEVATAAPSPLARGIAWQQLNTYIYRGDELRDSQISALSDEVIADVAHDPRLRPRLPNAAVERFRRKLQRVEAGYAPDSPSELVAWVAERLLIPLSEYRELLGRLPGDAALEEWPAYLAPRLVCLLPGAVGEPLVAAREMVPAARELFEAGAEPAVFAVEHAVSGAAMTAEPGQAAGLPGQVGGGGGVAGGDPLEREARRMNLLSNWLRFYGIIPSACLVDVLGLSAVDAAGLVSSLASEGRVIAGFLRTEAAEEEIADAENLELMLRAYRRSMRAEAARTVEPLRPEALVPFLARRQGLLDAAAAGSSVAAGSPVAAGSSVAAGSPVAAGSDRAGLERVLEPLFGYPAHCALWERDILPVRLPGYHPSMLDSLLHESGLLWAGAGRERVHFMLESEQAVYRDAARDRASGAGERVLESLHRLSSTGRPSGFWELVDATGLKSEEAAAALWQLAWRGLASADSFEPVRRGIASRFRAVAVSAQPEKRGRRAGYERWKSSRPTGARWLPLEAEDSVPGDLIGREELARERVRLLLQRYGVLFRELLSNELPALQWSSLFRTLRIMELSGEVVSGYFFRGTTGIQFAAPGALASLAAAQNVDEEPVYWMNACDPASPCGVGLAGLTYDLPPRLPSNHLVFRGSELVMISRRHGRELDINATLEDKRIVEYLGFFHWLLGRPESPVPRIQVEKIDGVPVRESPFQHLLVKVGFQRDFKNFVLLRRYR